MRVKIVGCVYVDGREEEDGKEREKGWGCGEEQKGGDGSYWTV